MKQAATVFGALAFGWMTVELAFRPILEKFRAAIDKADPSVDPDDVSDVTVAAAISAYDEDHESPEDLTKPDEGYAANDQ